MNTSRNAVFMEELRSAGRPAEPKLRARHAAAFRQRLRMWRDAYGLKNSDLAKALTRMAFAESEKRGLATIEHALAPSRPLTHRTVRRLAAALLFATHGKPAPLPRPRNVGEATVLNVRKNLWSRLREMIVADLRRTGAIPKTPPSFAIPGGPNRAWVAIATRHLRRYYAREGQRATEATLSAERTIRVLCAAFGQPREAACGEFATLDLHCKPNLQETKP